MRPSGSAWDASAEQFSELMGPDLGPAFDVLSSDLVLIHANWQIYKQLFANQARMNILMRAAFGLFALLRDALLFDVIAQLAAFVDDTETGRHRHKNLTIRSLPDLVAVASADSEHSWKIKGDLTSEVTAKVAEVCDECQFITHLRRKRIAHRDRDVALGISETPLPEVDYAKVDTVLAKSAATLNLVEASFASGATTRYEATVLADPESLFIFLDLGMNVADALALAGWRSPDTWRSD
jgi:hypothetical protein